MKKRKKEESYLNIMKDYQNKMNLPGSYLGGNLHPIFISKTKTGGYFMLLGGIILFFFYSFFLFWDFKVENIGWILGILFAVLLIVVGIKFIKLNSQK
jgi:hypothetical protein